MLPSPPLSTLFPYTTLFRSRLAIRVFLIEHEVLHTQNTQLVQSVLAFVRITVFETFRLRLHHHLFEVRGDHDARASLVNLRDAIAERRGSETAAAATGHHCRELLELRQLRARGKKIVLNPDVQPFFLVTRLNCAQRILHKLDLRSLLTTGILRDLLFEHLAEAGSVGQLSEHKRIARISLWVHRNRDRDLSAEVRTKLSNRFDHLVHVLRAA